MYKIDGCDSASNLHKYTCAHKSSRLGHEHARKSYSPPLAVLIEHTEEAIVSGRIATVIPLLGVTSYLVGVVELKSYEQVDNLRGEKWVNVCDRTRIAN